MPSRHAILRLACALGGLAIAGCYSPYRHAPYNPYGSGIPAYPQPVPVQPQFGPPAGSPTIIQPNGGFPPAGNYGGSQFNSGSGLTPTPDPGANSFPPSNNNGFAPSNGGFNPTLPPNSGSGTGLVPDGGYGDPENLPPTTGSGTFGGDRPAFGNDGASFQPDGSTESVRFDRNPAELQLASHQSSQMESRPVVSAAAEVVQPMGTTLAAKKPNPYGYDAISYRWLRGIVDFDEQRQSWILIYNPTPGPRDDYKGHITLIDNGQLNRLKNNDVVLVEGQVEPLSRDQDTGKPQYRVTKLYGPLVPKT